MRANICLIAILLMMIAVGLSTGCGKEETATTQGSATQAALPGNWKAALPANVTGLTVKDGGACYLDMVNNDAPGNAPILVRSGLPMSLAGWVVADQTAGHTGSALWVQLNAVAPYFITADGYQRPGLGAALKNPALDAGGLKLDPSALNVPAGAYEVLFLAQSGNELVRCDTHHALRVQ